MREGGKEGGRGEGEGEGEGEVNEDIHLCRASQGSEVTDDSISSDQVHVHVYLPL